MRFVHEDTQAFVELIERVAVRLDRDPFMIEKDYWVTHALYALQNHGFQIWFKGGTSLSKGFGLIERFSEDLDIKLEHPGIDEPSSWTSAKGKKHIASRSVFFSDVMKTLGELQPFTAKREDIPADDGSMRNLQVRLEWPGQVHTHVSGVLRDYVLLEIGSTRVTPHMMRTIGSWVHDELGIVGAAGDFIDNRPTIRCLHPLVTLIEKLTILEKCAPDMGRPPESFIRHFEDVAHIARAHLGGKLPEHPECTDVGALIDIVKRISRETLTTSKPAAFHFEKLPDGRLETLEHAHAAIGLLFFGPRISLAECAATVREWIASRVQ